MIFLEFSFVFYDFIFLCFNLLSIWNISDTKSKVVIQFDITVPNGCQMAQKPFCILSFLEMLGDTLRNLEIGLIFSLRSLGKPVFTYYMESTIITRQEISWYSCMSSLYILDINPLSELLFENNFFHLVGCLFVLFSVSFSMQKLFSLI